MARAPGSVSYLGKTYDFNKQLGSGGTSNVYLYGDEALGHLVLKVSYCSDPLAASKYQEELHALQRLSAAGPCAPESIHWRRRRSTDVDPVGWMRKPLSWTFEQGCFYTLLDYYPQSLAQWLEAHQERSVEQVCGIFLQILSIVSCLSEKKIYYNDLKPSNLLVRSEAGDPVPGILVGDLGGLDFQGDPRITVTPSRLPPSLLKDLKWKKIDVLTGFLLGELIFQLLFRATRGEEVHPMNSFLKCIQSFPRDSCAREHLLSALETRLCKNLPLSSGRIRDLAALGLNFLGFEGLFVPVSEATRLQSDLWK
jgi:serine/threonine protein kinase